MCVWITAESVFQCLGTDTFCPTSAPSLVPGNTLGDNTLDDTGNFSANACVLSCFNCVNCASTQLSSFFMWFCGLDATKWWVVSSKSDLSDSGWIPVRGLNGFLCRASTRRQVHASCFTRGHVHPDQWTWLTVAYQAARVCSAGREQRVSSQLQILDPN